MNTTYVLKHKATGELYAGMVLGADYRTNHPANARQWRTASAAARYGAKFGERYAVVSR